MPYRETHPPIDAQDWRMARPLAPCVQWDWDSPEGLATHSQEAGLLLFF